MRIGRAVKLVGAVALSFAGCSACLAAEGEGSAHPQTWLDGLLALRVAGRPLIHGQAGLAFAWSLVAIGILAVVSVLATRRLSIRPKGTQALLEMVVGQVRGLVVGVMGPRGVDFVPFIGALFIYIAVMNLLGLVPGCMSPTANLNITAGLALVVFGVVHYYGVRERGAGYIEHFIEGVPMQFPYFLLAPLVFAVHLVGELFRPVTLALRLFGNLMAKETVLAIFIGLVAGLAHRGIFLPVQLPNMILGIVVSLVQAAIFAMLTAVYLAGVLREQEAHE